jgi:AcrR family transcriptional regulator
MPPKVKVTKEDIINAAVDIVRSSGAQAINARTIASALNCSTQPVFSNFATMDELRLAVVEKADILCQEYMQREVESGEFPTYKANGMAYIRFAKEEKELFKFLYMRDRSSELIPETTEQTEKMESIVHDNTGLSGADAKLFHLEMWAYVHGITTMIATDFENLDFELVSRMLTDAYLGMRKQYEME